MNTTYTIQDIKKHSSIEEERNKILSDTKFIQWCKDLNIGARVEVRGEGLNNALDMMQQYTNYPKWVSRMY